MAGCLRMAILSKTVFCLLGLLLLSSCASVRRAKEVKTLSHFRVFVNEVEAEAYVEPEVNGPKSVDLGLAGLLGLVFESAGSSKEKEDAETFREDLTAAFGQFPTALLEERLQDVVHDGVLLEKEPVFVPQDELKRFNLKVSKIGLDQVSDSSMVGLYQFVVVAEVTPMISAGQTRLVVQVRFNSRSSVSASLEAFATDKELCEKVLLECIQKTADNMKSYLLFRGNLKEFSSEEVFVRGANPKG